MSKSADAFRTIGEVADELDVPKHVLRFWEGKFPQIRPMKRGGGRRFYRPEDLELLRGIRHLLHAQGYTIKGVQKILKEQGIDQVKEAARAAVEQAQAAPKRGRRPILPASYAVRTGSADAEAGKTRAVPVEVASGRRIPADLDERVQAAIKELLACRAILSELRAAETASAIDNVPVEVRRRAASG